MEFTKRNVMNFIGMPVYFRFSFFYNLCSKQNQLWMEGTEFYKGKPSHKPEHHQYGIYSIKQREVSKSSNGNSLQNSCKGDCKLNFLFIFYANSF